MEETRASVAWSDIERDLALFKAMSEATGIDEYTLINMQFKVDYAKSIFAMAKGYDEFNLL